MSMENEKGLFATSSTTSLGYIVYKPKDVTPGLPMIVFLHGAGERGTDLELVNVNAIPKYLKEGSREIPAIVLCPQCPAGFVWNNLVVTLKALIDKVAAEYAVDTDRIAITGISMGGYGTWEMGYTYGDFFSCAAPVCGGGVSWRSGEGKLTKIPVWAFHGDADTVVPPVNSIENVDRINAAGGNAKLTLFHGVAHNSWDPAYCETTVIEWMLAQKRKH